VIADNEVQIGAENLEAGEYQLTYSGGGLLAAGITLNVDATFQTEVGEGQVVSGNVLEGDALGADDAATLMIDPGDGTYVEVTDGMEIVGDYGTLTIDADGSYDYEAFDDVTNNGQQ